MTSEGYWQGSEEYMNNSHASVHKCVGGGRGVMSEGKENTVSFFKRQ